MEGKITLYKEGYHVLLRQLKRMRKEMDSLKKENKRLKRLVAMHEEVSYMLFDC